MNTRWIVISLLALGAAAFLQMVPHVPSTPQALPVLSRPRPQNRERTAPSTQPVRVTSLGIRPQVAHATLEMGPEWLTSEARAMNAIDENPSASAQRIQQIARDLSPTDVLTLKAVALDPHGGQNERMLAVHLLILNPATSSDIFVSVASMDDPAMHDTTSAGEFQNQLVTALALSALDHIQTQALQNAALVSEIKVIGEHSPSRLIKKLALQMSGALESGRTYAVDIR